MNELETVEGLLREAFRLLLWNSRGNIYDAQRTAATRKIEAYFESREAKLEWSESVREGVMSLINTKGESLAWVASHPRGGYVWSAQIGAAIVDCPTISNLAAAKEAAEAEVRRLLLRSYAS